MPDFLQAAGSPPCELVLLRHRVLCTAMHVLPTRRRHHISSTPLNSQAVLTGSPINAPSLPADGTMFGAPLLNDGMVLSRRDYT